MTPSRFMLMVVASLCLRGNAFIEKCYIRRKVGFSSTVITSKHDGETIGKWHIEYTYTMPKSNKRVIPIKKYDIRGFGMDGVCGMIPIQIGRDSDWYRVIDGGGHADKRK